MIRAQAVAAVTSWISNRRNDFRDAVTRRYTPSRWGGAAKRRFERLPAEKRAAIEADLALLRHELHAINNQKAWLVPADIAVMRKIDGGTKKGQLVPVSDRARQLARTIFLGIAFRHRWPRFERLAMRFDDRAGFGLDGAKAWIEPAHAGGLFAWWLHLRTKTMDAPVLLPIRGWGRDRGDDRGVGIFRPGALGKTVNVFLGDDGKLKVALTRDMTEVFVESRESYHPLTDVLALDFGLTNLFASNHGDLVGRGFMQKIRPVAERADREARRMQRAGRKPRESALYRNLVRRLRAMIEAQVNRALNHMVAMHRPRVLAVEKLDFRGSALGRRMNRVLTNCGRGAVATQARRPRRPLRDRDPRGRSRLHLEDLFRLRLRRCEEPHVGNERFHCRFCGRQMHADVNGARNIAQAVTGQPADHRSGQGRRTFRSSWRAIARRTKTEAKGLVVAPDPELRAPRDRSGASTRAWLTSVRSHDRAVEGRAPGRAPRTRG